MFRIVLLLCFSTTFLIVQGQFSEPDESVLQCTISDNRPSFIRESQSNLKSKQSFTSTQWLIHFPNLNELAILNTKSESIPALQGFLNLETFILNTNPNLTGLAEDFFEATPKLKRIFITEKDAIYLPRLIFRGLNDLSYIRLNLMHTELNEDIFQDLPHLETLILISFDANSIPHRIFRNLHHLKRLEITNGSFEAADFRFQDLTSLEELKLTSSQIERIPRNFFNGLSNLKELHLSDNKIKTIDRTALEHLPRLERLYLSDNQLSLFAFDGVNGTFSWSDFDQNLPRLKSVDLDSNQLSYVNFTVFKIPPSFNQDCPKDESIMVSLKSNPIIEFIPWSFEESRNGINLSICAIFK